jgi:4-alpha-glucanotransferase
MDARLSPSWKARMKDSDLQHLAARAGIAVDWTDAANFPRKVALPTLRRLLQALNLPCDSASDLRESFHRLDSKAKPAVVTVDAGRAAALPPSFAGNCGRLILESGAIRDVAFDAGLATLRALGPGRHRLVTDKNEMIVIAAPGTCFRMEDVAPGRRLSGLAAQIYSLTHANDFGIGDMGGVTALTRAAASLGIDALALSPMHALFSADPGHFSPYSPSSRLFLNPLHANPIDIVGHDLAQEALERAVFPPQVEMQEAPLIDWPVAARAKAAWFRALYGLLIERREGSAGETLWCDIAEYRRGGGESLERHACFEALHAARRSADGSGGDWRLWPAGLRAPDGPAINPFSEAPLDEIDYHVFLQWLADRSLAKAQRVACDAGMRIGLIADLAVGISPAGSEAWSHQKDILGGLTIGAPPDLFNPDGQDWGLTTFSPQALAEAAFEPFAATLRAAMRHVGGARIDHVMGLRRLWLIPEGASPAEGAYLSYPFEDLMRIVALESMRHRAIVVAEDLGTVPEGFRDDLAARGVLGMNILWFERRAMSFTQARLWPATSVAMTSTHDLPTLAGWWSGHDIGVRAQLREPGDGRWRTEQDEARRADRALLWDALVQAAVVETPMPDPEETSPFVAAALAFVAQAPAPLVLFSLEDVLALRDQPNLPGTIDEHPNWRRRLDRDPTLLLDSPFVRARLAKIASERSGP